MDKALNYVFDIDTFAKNNILLSFNAALGTCNLYLNTEVIYSFTVNVDQMVSKNIIFGDFNVSTVGNPVPQRLQSTTKNIGNLYLSLQPLSKEEELAAIFNQNLNEVQDITISLPCGMRNLTDTIATVNSINSNLKNKSNVIDINIKNLNINDANITDKVKNILWTNIRDVVPQSTTINNINFIDYK